MAHNSRVTADQNGPPITRILADFVATHPTQGWDADVEREANRTLLNWVGCAIGASRHATVEAALAAVRGLVQTYSTKCDWSEIADGLGWRFEISFNTYKPFACGIVIHPSIDGCVQLAALHGLSAGDIERIELKVHPLVLELTGKTAPRTGLEGKFSVYHASAAGFLFGKAGEAEFADHVVARADVIALRNRVHATTDTAIGEASADVTVTCTDRRRFHTFVSHAIGSLERPMTDADLARKFRDLVDPVLGATRAEGLIEQCSALSACTDVRSLAAQTRN